MNVGDDWACAVPAGQFNIGCFPHDRPRLGFACICEVLLDLGLPVDQDVATGQSFKINPMMVAAKGELEASVHQAVLHHPIPNPRLFEQTDGGPLQ